MIDDAPPLFRILVHEAAHLVVAQHFGCSSKQITIKITNEEIEGAYLIGDEVGALTAHENRMLSLAGRSAVAALVDHCTEIAAIAARPLSPADALGAGAHDLADIVAATNLVIALRAQILDVAQGICRQVHEPLLRKAAL